MSLNTDLKAIRDLDPGKFISEEHLHSCVRVLQTAAKQHNDCIDFISLLSFTDDVFTVGWKLRQGSESVQDPRVSHGDEEPKILFRDENRVAALIEAAKWFPISEIDLVPRLTWEGLRLEELADADLAQVLSDLTFRQYANRKGVQVNEFPEAIATKRYRISWNGDKGWLNFWGPAAREALTLALGSFGVGLVARSVRLWRTEHPGQIKQEQIEGELK